jgi:hypothetical protein
MPDRNWRAREGILGRLRAAPPLAGRQVPETPAPALDAADPLALFGERFVHYLTVGGEVCGSYRVVRDAHEAGVAAAEILRAGGVRSWLTWPTALCELAAASLPLEQEPPPPGSPPEAAIVEADLLCLETGTFALRSGPGRARSDALLPPVQIVLAHGSSMAARLDEALERAAAWPSAQVVWVAGPSRTADVEKTLVVPAHGSSEVHLIVVAPAG